MRGLGVLEILAAVVIGIGAVRGATAPNAGEELAQATTFAGAQLSAFIAAALLLAGIYTVKSPRAGLLAQALVAVLLAVVVPILRA
jgi:hypothetical protein